MKPDKPGFWHSRDGKSARVRDCNGELGAELYSRSLAVVQGLVPANALPGDDWLPATPPEFPPLPERPLLCLCKTPYGTQWCTHREGYVQPLTVDVWLRSDTIKVISHPDNDPEAVRLIEEARAKA